MLNDLRISLRGLVRAPMMTLTIIVTVGLGIGATTVIFSAIQAALLRPLPYADPDRLVRIYTDAPPYKFRFSVADYQALEKEQTHFEQIGAYTDRAMAFSDGTVAERVRGRQVTWTYFATLGIRPAIGRDFTASDGRPGNPPAVIVSNGFWQRRLGGRPEAVGKPIRLDGADYTLAGVLPPSVGPLEQRQEFFVAAQLAPPPRKGPFPWIVIGRLRQGAGEREAAGDELRAINRRLFPIWKTSYQDQKATWGLMSLKTHVTGDVGTVAALSLVSVALVWLIACANASNLLIARVTSRRRELGVRAALGASRARVVRHLLAESALLAAGASAMGIVLAWQGVGVLRDFGAGYFPRTQEIALDGTVLGLLAALTAASVVLFGAIPALYGTGGPVDESLRSTGRSSTGTVAVRRLRRILVASQFAIATPLLIVAGLLLASLDQLSRVDLGFDTHNVLSASMSLPAATYVEPARVEAFWTELQRRAEALPGITRVGYADGIPPNFVGNFNNFDLEDSPTPAGQSQPVTAWVAVTPEYFRLLGLTLFDGRLLEERDRAVTAGNEIVVDRAWQRRFFPNQSAVGKRLRNGGCTTCAWNVVVGVVSEVKYSGVDKPDEGTVYTPLPAGDSPNPARTRFIVLRTAADPASVAPGLRQIVRELDPTLPLSAVATMDVLVAQSLQAPRSMSLLVGGFAIVALLLSVVGVYGVMAYYVQQHTKDISIRLALGGSPGHVLRLIVGQGMAVVSSGVVVGVIVALGLARVISTLLFRVGAADAFTFGAVTLLMLGVALLACVVPARRAIAVQPAEVLRAE
ncbi:MAG TPA: ABC transporter permease [Vicinamibacterales bacterium]|nr:ABC transporter permease [Vicinamibacterales bacterium]